MDSIMGLRGIQQEVFVQHLKKRLEIGFGFQLPKINSISYSTIDFGTRTAVIILFEDGRKSITKSDDSAYATPENLYICIANSIKSMLWDNLPRMDRLCRENEYNKNLIIYVEK